MSRYAKALVALIPVVLAGLKVLYDGLGDGAVTTQEWVAVAVAAFTAAGVYLVPNRPSAGQAPDPRVSEQGFVGVGPLLVILVGAAVLLLAVVWVTS